MKQLLSIVNYQARATAHCDRFFLFKILCPLFVAALFLSCTGKHSGLESGFIEPPANIRTSVYWYWINDNISKEGVIKDLQAMKQAGITRAFIGNIGGETSFPRGKIHILSDEWWDVMHTALKTATELDIEIGIFNCPGWSQSGGPWIKPEQSMRYLASVEKQIAGPVKLSEKLTPPTANFQDVKTLAFPVGKEGARPNLFNIPGAKILTSGNISKSDKGYALPKNEESHIVLQLPEAEPARSLIIHPLDRTVVQCELQVKENGEFKTVKQFNVNRSNLSRSVGFYPLSPVSVSFPEVKAAEYRLVFSKTEGKSDISVTLTPAPVVERYAEKTLAKMYQWPLPYWHEYMWDAQSADASLSIDPKQVVDISKNLSADGTLTWDVPEGEWIIMRTGMAPTGTTNAPAAPNATGPEVDKMSKEHAVAHFDAYLGELLKRIPEADRKSFKVIVQDSYETGGQNFTDGMIEKFKQRYGYDPVPYLPAIQGYSIGSPDLSDRFLWDLRRMVADKVAYDYVGGLRDVGHKHGLTTWLECYGHWGFPGEFLQYGGQSDEIGGEFWADGDLGNIECRAASSCAHIYGKTSVSAESFTSGADLNRYPARLKRCGDWSFTEGINNTLLHVYIQQPYEDVYPGISAWFGTEFNRKNTWFSHIDLFIKYIRRCNFMLQQGQNVADVAYFIGEEAPKMTGIREPGLPKGYGFDYINSEVIIRDLTVKNGLLTLPHGTSYRILVLPPQETIRPKLLQKIEQLVAAGAVILGPKPNRSPSLEGYPQADNTVRELADKMWGESAKQRVYGEGKILTETTLEEAFALLNLPPDCRSEATDPLLYVHRTLGDAEIYFISNQSDKVIRINPEFRVQGLKPELWDAVNGVVRPLPAFAQKGDITSVPIQLDAYESAFVIFREKGKPSASGIEVNYPEPVLLADISAPSLWSVALKGDADKINQDVAFEAPETLDWSKSKDDLIRYFSGTAVYESKVTIDKIPSGNTIFLDFDKVVAMGKVKINGQYAGGVWTAPYRVDITEYIHTGENKIEVEVVNTWTNRVIGDSRLPESERRLNANANPNQPLNESGIIGQVKIVGIKN
jgi:hypothetical protein